jgi:predicted PhzF superfamily epimerase YddE/YHI9
MEMNLSETAFFVRNASCYELRWFTPRAEVDLCGHATLATAVVLARLGELADGAGVDFSTRSGVLAAMRHGSRFHLDFPALHVEPHAPPPGLVESLNVTGRSIGRGTTDFLIEVESESAVRNVTPDFRQLATVDCRGVVVTARSDDPQFDFVSRFFAPVVGVDEDPVTGSAHCLLAPYWGVRLGKSKMVGFQASSRGGTVYVEVRGDRVMLGGDGVVFATGEMTTA